MLSCTQGAQVFLRITFKEEKKETTNSLWEAQHNKRDLWCSSPKKWLQAYIPAVDKETQGDSG